MSKLPEGICTISSALLPPSVAVRQGIKVVASQTKTGVFELENVGENIYRIKVPGQDLVWALEREHRERTIYLAPDENEVWQRFRIYPQEGPLESYRIEGFDGEGGREVFVLGLGTPAGDAVNIAGFPEIGGPAVSWIIQPQNIN